LRGATKHVVRFKHWDLDVAVEIVSVFDGDFLEDIASARSFPSYFRPLKVQNPPCCGRQNAEVDVYAN